MCMEQDESFITWLSASYPFPYPFCVFGSTTITNQAYSKPRCDGAAPNRQLVMNGLSRKIDHYHYASVRL